MASLLDRLVKNSTVDLTSALHESEVYNTKDSIPTPIPALNIAYSSRVDKGIAPGLTIWAGPSKHFKTLFCLITAAAYLKKYPDAVCLFYDSEFGSPADYFKSAGINPERVIHTPITNVEELRHDLANQLPEINRGDRVIIIVDSLGNLASSKEIKDAEDGSEKADMTRAKVIKSLFRIVTPHLRLKDIPMLVVSHTYDTMEMYSKKVVSGGTGQYYSADNIYIVGRQQDKDGKDLVGFDFIINVEKSRYVKEKSKIPISVQSVGGVRKWSGLLDLALEGGYITKPNQQSYLIKGFEDKYKRSEIENNGDVFKQLFTTTDFAEFIHTKYAVSAGDLITEDQIEDTEELIDIE